MIGFLRGQVIENADGKLLVMAGANGESGVGYQIAVPAGAEYDDLLPGKKVDLHVYTHVREDALDLYGFRTRGEKELFLTLLSVNGIGPKVAMGILSKVSPGLLIQAVLSGKKEELTQIPGIGKKTAERVVLELADPLRKKSEAGLFQGIAPRAAGAALDKLGGARAQASRESAVLKDARAALVGLGYREQDVNSLLKTVMEETEAPPQRAEDLIRTALSRMAGRGSAEPVGHARSKESG
jgi:Holliday junction DNA helicase RuvA